MPITPEQKKVLNDLILFTQMTAISYKKSEKDQKVTPKSAAKNIKEFLEKSLIDKNTKNLFLDALPGAIKQFLHEEESSIQDLPKFVTQDLIKNAYVLSQKEKLTKKSAWPSEDLTSTSLAFTIHMITDMVSIFSHFMEQYCDFNNQINLFPKESWHYLNNLITFASMLLPQTPDITPLMYRHEREYLRKKKEELHAVCFRDLLIQVILGVKIEKPYNCLPGESIRSLLERAPALVGEHGTKESHIRKEEINFLKNVIGSDDAIDSAFKNSDAFKDSLKKLVNAYEENSTLIKNRPVIKRLSKECFGIAPKDKTTHLEKDQKFIPVKMSHSSGFYLLSRIESLLGVAPKTTSSPLRLPCKKNEKDTLAV